MTTETMKAELKFFVEEAKSRIQDAEINQQYIYKHDDDEVYSERWLSKKEQAHILGLHWMCRKRPEFTSESLVHLTKHFPIKFATFKKLLEEEPDLVEEVCDHGYFYMCDRIVKNRILTEQERNAKPLV